MTTSGAYGLIIQLHQKQAMQDFLVLQASRPVYTGLEAQQKHCLVHFWSNLK